MRSLNLLYTTQQNLAGLLEQSGISCGEPCFVRVYTAICTPDEAVAIACEIRALLPNAAIIGATGSGIIYNAQQYDADTLVIVEQYDDAEMVLSQHCFDGKSAEALALEVARAVAGRQVKLMHLLAGNHYNDVSSFVERLNQHCPGTTLIGGVVGDILPKNIEAYVFDEHGVIEHGIITASLCGSSIQVFRSVSTAHEPISPLYSLDKCGGNYLLEINGRSAVQWCRDQLGMEDLQEYAGWQLIAENDALVRFPLILEGHNGASRFLKYDSAARKISLYYSELPDNTPFRVGYTSPTKCVQECVEICNSISKTPVESLFCYTCLFRKLYLGNCAEWELRPFRNHGICGVFMMGEIATIHDRYEFLNGSCCFEGTADTERYISPDFSVFEDLYKITDDNRKLHSFILQKQSVAMSLENRMLLEKLLEQQERARAQLYLDQTTGIANTIKFAQDNQQRQFNKMCICQIENSHLIISHFGQDHYHHLLNRAIDQVRHFAAGMKQHDSLFFYTLNESTFFFAAGPDISELYYMEAVRTLYDRFQFFNLGGKDELLIVRFVTVLNEKNLLEKGLSTLQSSRYLQTHFLLSDQSGDAGQSVESEMEMLHILNMVIEHGWVEPYFQGIHDNRTGRLDKYEALMRIHDAEGNIYPPLAFMDIAKRYHLYAALSRQMLDKVFTLFGDTDLDVSINLSAYDINFDDMRQFIFERLDQLDSAHNFIFEILEDENFRDTELLRMFIARAREYGVRIAIDDFGSGYSNFMEIARMEPDFIKVDGAIVRSVVDSSTSQKVLANIAFLGKQLEADLIAEFVEDGPIQAHIEALDIHYSQGYHFARPRPYAELFSEARGL